MFRDLLPKKDLIKSQLNELRIKIDKYKEVIDKFGKGQISCGETKKLLLECVEPMFKIIREGKIESEQIKDYFIIKDS